MNLRSLRQWMKGASLQRDAREIRDLLVKYVKEETVQPLKDLGRYALWGTIGSVFVAFGTVLILFGALRFLQAEFPVLNGSLSWIPYLVIAVLAAIVIALTLWRITTGEARRRIKKSS